MGSRYYLTGVQLGMLIALSEKREFKQIRNLIKEIEDKQYLCEDKDLNKFEKA